MDKLDACFLILFVICGFVAVMSRAAWIEEVEAMGLRHTTTPPEIASFFLGQFRAFSMMSILSGSAIIIKRYWGSLTRG